MQVESTVESSEKHERMFVGLIGTPGVALLNGIWFTGFDSDVDTVALDENDNVEDETVADGNCNEDGVNNDPCVVGS